MIARAWRRLFPPDQAEDGFGQSWRDDLLYWRRWRACRRQEVVWRKPTADEAARWAAHPIVGRFGDDTVAVAAVDGRDWVVRENDWHGWPDPKRYHFFVLEGDAIWVATEFDAWPRAWGPEPAYSV